MEAVAFDGAATLAWMHRFADSVHATESELTSLDQQAGDGDFGNNLAAGVQAAQGLLQADGVAADPSQVLTAMARAFLDEIGGTSGPLFGLLFQAISRAARADGRQLTATGLTEGTRNGLEAIRRVGEAAPGDKTLIDALHPAVEALDTCAGASTGQALASAADAAWTGVRATAGLTARRGRASYLGSRSAGVADPGAVGVALFLASAQGTVPSVLPHLQGRT